MDEIVLKILIWGPIVLTAIVLHELAHGWVAYQLGDSTAKDAGRLTLNPISHIDPVGSIVLPLILLLTHSGFMFGYAKPVPVRFGNLRSPRRDMVLVAGAGPAMNVVLAVISALIFRLVMDPNADEVSMVATIALRSVAFNVVIAVFNMTPILPLDGGRVMAGLLPLELARSFAKLEPYGMLIVMMLLATGSLNPILGPVVNAVIRVLL